jgi:hypothetical protein
MFDWMMFWWQARQFWSWISYGPAGEAIAHPRYPGGAVMMAYAVARSNPLHRVYP